MTMNVIHASVLAGLVFVGALLAFQRGQLQELAGARAKVEAAQGQTAEALKLVERMDAANKQMKQAVDSLAADNQKLIAALNRANRGEPKETPQP